ncbi:unnamed protein product [Schistosoma margrebowiei]|uniref:Uncharacterized protein n=1 Tax=Schistosoma margrebowiei TaxID=48269 RepID=A0A183LD21_9TREM|nr:unnamed protein product [Schistosoma margrebowiei]
MKLHHKAGDNLEGKRLKGNEKEKTKEYSTSGVGGRHQKNKTALGNDLKQELRMEMARETQSVAYAHTEGLTGVTM